MLWFPSCLELRKIVNIPSIPSDPYVDHPVRINMLIGLFLQSEVITVSPQMFSYPNQSGLLFQLLEIRQAPLVQQPFQSSKPTSTAIWRKLLLARMLRLQNLRECLLQGLQSSGAKQGSPEHRLYTTARACGACHRCLFGTRVWPFCGQ